MLVPGDKAPDFTAQADDGTSIRLSDLRGRKVVLYFYPKDGTPGCTWEACSFRNAHPEFEARNAVVLGVSSDSIRSHKAFKSLFKLPFRLISDPHFSIARAYGVQPSSTILGKTPLGRSRSTFVIDETGTIATVHGKVNVRRHVADLLSSL